MMSRENDLSHVLTRTVRLHNAPTLRSFTGPSIAGSGPGGKKKFPPPPPTAARTNPVKVGKADCQLQSDLDLVRKGQFLQSKNNDTNEKDKTICNTAGAPRPLFRTAWPR